MFAWRMGLFFSPVVVSLSPEPYGALTSGRVAYLLVCVICLVVLFRGGKRTERITDKLLVGAGTLAAVMGTLVVIVSSAVAPPLTVVGFAVAGFGDACLTLAFASLYRSLSVRLSMRAVPAAMAIAAGLYALVVNNPVSIAFPVLIVLPVVCGATIGYDLKRREASALSSLSPESCISPVEASNRNRFTKWRIASYTSVLWFSFGVMWPLAVARLYESDGFFLAFSLSVTALIMLVSAVLIVITYVLRMPMVRAFWIFAPLTFAGITVVAILDSNVQILAFAMVFAAHSIAEVQLITHFSAICRRRGYSTSMLFGCGFAILNVGEIVGLLVGMTVVSLHSTALTMILLVCANVIVIAVIFSIMRVNTTFQKAELEAALAKQASQLHTEANVVPAPSMEQAVDGWGEKFGLSAREKEVAQLLLSGRNVPAVADLLCISQSTVQTHVKHIYERTGVHSRQELIALGHESLDELLSEQRK